jgi:hypothetical protein
MTLNSSQGLTKIKNFLDKKILEVEAELNNSDSLFKKEILILKRHALEILKIRTSNNLKLLNMLETQFLKNVQDLTESLVDTFRFDPDDFDVD